MTKVEKLRTSINDAYEDAFDAAFGQRWGVKVTTRWNVIDGELVTERTDGEPLTDEQGNWLSAFSDGYAAAMGQVTE
jgi:hypothetical protein